MSQICSGNMFARSLDWKIPPFLVFSNWERNALVYRGESSQPRKRMSFFKTDLLELALAAFHNYDLLECNVGSEAISDILGE